MQGVIQDPAGFMPTRDEYAKAQRVADNLAAQLAQARAEIARLSAELRTAQAGWRADQEAGAAEVARLKDGLAEADTSAQMMADEFYEVSEGAYLIDPVQFDAHRQAIRAALRGDPAPAVCSCQNYPDGDGDGAVLSLRDHACPVHGDPAPATGRE